MKASWRNRKLVCMFSALILSVLLTTGVMAATKVAKVNNKTYTSLAKALSAARNGDTITLLDAVKTSSAVKITKNVTIDFAQKNYTYTGSDFAFVVTKKTVFKNGKAFASKGGLIKINKKASLTIQSGKYVNGQAANACLLLNNGTLTVKNGTFISTESNALVNDSGTVRIINGKFSNKLSVSKKNAPAVVNMSGTMTIDHGTFRSTYGNALQNYNKGICTIKNGSFISTQSASVNNTNNSVLNIKNGTFGKKGVTYVSGVRNLDGTVRIYGGTIMAAESRGDGSPVFIMLGGTINGFDNNSGYHGWALHIMQNSKFYMKGGKIKGEGTLVYLNQKTCYMKMTGGRLENTLDAGQGGVGVYTGEAKAEFVSGTIAAEIPYIYSQEGKDVSVSDGFVIIRK